jgi:hypothetical protein
MSFTKWLRFSTAVSGMGWFRAVRRTFNHASTRWVDSTLQVLRKSTMKSRAMVLLDFEYEP